VRREEKRAMGSLLRLLLPAVLLVAFSCASPERLNKAEAHYKMGISYLNAENAQSAFVEFQKALELNPGSSKVHNAIGIVHLNLKDYDKARESFLKAVKIDPEYSEAYNNLCYVHYALRQWENAVESCNRALANPLYPTPWKAFYNLGRSHYRLGQYDEAIQAFQNAVKRYSALYPAQYGLSLAYNAKGMYGEAASAMKKAVELDPRFKGDREKAEMEFSLMKAADEEDKDLRDYIEILKY
jgi:Tfp pilus assembly protein PilF